MMNANEETPYYYSADGTTEAYIRVLIIHNLNHLAL